MYRIDNATAAASLAAATSPGVNPDGYFTAGDPGSGTPATVVDAEWANMIQEEIANVIEDADAGNTPLDKSSRTQLKDAIAAMISGVGGTHIKASANGKPYEYVSASSVKIPSGFNVTADDGTGIISFSADQTASMASTGANGLQSGSSEASNTWYNLYAIGDSTGVNASKGFIVPQGTAVVLPSGYDIKCSIGCFRNDSSSDIIPFIIGTGYPGVYEYLYNVQFATTTAGATNVLNAGSASSYTAISCASFIHPSSTVGLFWVENKIANTHTYLRTTGTSLDGFTVNGEGDDQPYDNVLIPVNGSQQIDYKKNGGGSAYISVRGFLFRIGA